MPLINLQEIKTKNTTWYKAILKISFEYLLLRVSEEYSKKNDIKSPYQFNNENDITAAKLLLYPYFVATSNGHSNYLFHLFGDFYTFSLGPMSTSVLDLLNGEKKLVFFETDLEENFDSLKISKVTEETTWVELKNSLLEYKIEYNEQSFPFKEFTVKSDSDSEKALYSAIDSGINALKTQSDNYFFIADLDSLQFQANYSWKYRISRREDKIEIINYDDVKDDARPFYLIEND